MAVRFLLAALGVPFLLFACGDSTSTPAGSAGASPQGVISGFAGANASGSPGVSGSPASSGGAGANAGSAGAGLSVAGHAQGGAAQGASGSGGVVAGSGGAAGLGTGGAEAGSANATGSGGQQSGVPENWLPVTDVDYSIVPGPNFETVRLMFEAAQCSGSSCHYGGRNHFQMGKSADQLYSYMMSFKTLYCGKLIDTANPSESALVKYLRGPCGDMGRMPYMKCWDDGDELCVPEYYIQAIEQWIAKGAPR